MITINAISNYIPQQSVDINARAADVGIEQDFINNKLGIENLPIKSQQQETSDLGVEAVKSLLESSNLNIEDIDCLIVCTQNPDEYGLPHTSAIIHDKLGLHKQIACFDISLGCSGYIYGLKVAQGMMLANDYNNAILVTADPYSKIINAQDRNTSLLFGDAASATWLGREGSWELGKALLNTDGSGHRNIINIDQKLHMDGRQVFNFALTHAPKQIIDLLELAGYDIDHIDRFYLHQGSKYIVDSIRKRMKLAEEKVPANINQTGNTVSSSIPLLLEQDLDNPDLKNIILCGFGVGLSWGTILLHRADVK